MKRLGLFLIGALVVFELSYALSDTRMFFGGDEPAPVAGTSDRPAVEAALARLDAALAKYYADGDEAPLRAVLFDPEGERSPLHAWRVDRHIWLQQQGSTPTLSLLSRRVVRVSVFGLESVSATAEESWDSRLDGGSAPRAGLVMQYGLRRAPGGLQIESVGIEP